MGKSQERAIAMVSQNVGMISRVVGSVFGGFSITLPFPERAIAPFNAATLNPSRALRIAAAHTHTHAGTSECAVIIVAAVAAVAVRRNGKKLARPIGRDFSFAHGCSLGFT